MNLTENLSLKFRVSPHLGKSSRELLLIKLKMFLASHFKSYFKRVYSKVFILLPPKHSNLFEK